MLVPLEPLESKDQLVLQEQQDQAGFKELQDRLVRLEAQVLQELLALMAQLEPRAQQALLVDKAPQGLPELLALMVLQELLA